MSQWIGFGVAYEYTEIDPVLRMLIRVWGPSLSTSLGGCGMWRWNVETFSAAGLLAGHTHLLLATQAHVSWLFRYFQ